MRRHLRGLLVAAAVSLASASEPFSWADAQNAMHACTNGSKPLVDKYAYLSTRHALGNALSGWMHVFMYALASGRQPVVGSGPAPRLMCGRDGAFSCGVPKPGPSLRPAFAAAAIKEAEHWWLGDLSEFRAVVSDAISPAYRGDWRTRNVFRHRHCYDGWWTLDGSRTVPPQPIPKRRRGPGPRRHPAGPPRKHRDPERARARARAVAAARPHHRKNLSPREVAAAIADEVGRGK